jgi:hypothetical protein
MFPVRRWLSVLALLLCACGSSEPPVPSIVSVSPAHFSRSECVLLSVELDGALPVKLDYGKDSAELARLAKLGIGEREVPVEAIEDQGRRLVAHLFEGLPVGKHNVRVTLEDGEQLVLPDAIEVTGALVLDTFQFDQIGPQLRETPFPITLRATGPDAQRFQGRVLLRSNKGKLEPEWSNNFLRGVLTQEVSIDLTGGNVIIEMVDCDRRTVSSNEFRLDPKP